MTFNNKNEGWSQIAESSAVRRLVSVFLNEGFVEGYFIPTHFNGKLEHTEWIQPYITNNEGELEGQLIFSRIRDGDRSELFVCPDTKRVHYIIGCTNKPLTFPGSLGLERVSHVHPEDLCSPIYCIQNQDSNPLCSVISNPTDFINAIQPEPSPRTQILEQIIVEMESSVQNLTKAYRKYGFDIPKIGDPNIVWEQRIIEGHPFHPMHKSRVFVEGIPDNFTDKQLEDPKIHLFIVPKTQMEVYGKNYENLMELVLGIKPSDPNSYIVPVHEAQAPIVQKLFPSARQTGIVLESCQPQASIRTVSIAKNKNFNFKLPIAMLISSSLRTLTKWTVSFSPEFSALVELLLKESTIGKVLKVAAVHSGIVVKHEDILSSRHFSCLIRDDPEALKEDGEAVVVCAALTERLDYNKCYVLPHILKLDSEESCLKFLKEYICIALPSFLGPAIKWGIAFEAHLQNCLARFFQDSITKEWKLSGFIVRDFGGVYVHLNTLILATRKNIDLFNPTKHPNLSETMEKIFLNLYHSFIQCHLYHIIRALRLHYNGLGWRLLRKEINNYLTINFLENPLVPEIEANNARVMEALWLNSSESKVKCFFRMKLAKICKSSIWRTSPNLILFDGNS